MMSRTLPLAVVAATISGLLARPAAAQPTPEQQFAQQSLRMEGSEVMRGDWPVYPTTLYLLTGRADLRERLRTRALTRTLLVSAGGALLIVSFVWGLHDAAKTTDTTDPLTGTTTTTSGGEISPYPWIIAAVGGATMITGFLLPTDPVGSDEKEALIRDYNRRLRESMGLTGALETARRTARITAVPTLDGRSGMLIADFAF